MAKWCDSASALRSSYTEERKVWRFHPSDFGDAMAVARSAGRTGDIFGRKVRFGILRRDVERKMLEPLRTYNWAANIEREVGEGEYCLYDYYDQIPDSILEYWSGCL